MKANWENMSPNLILSYVILCLEVKLYHADLPSHII